jgi:hypothetical protein
MRAAQGLTVGAFPKLRFWESYLEFTFFQTPIPPGFRDWHILVFCFAKLNAPPQAAGYPNCFSSYAKTYFVPSRAGKSLFFRRILIRNKISRLSAAKNNYPVLHRAMNQAASGST